MRLVVQQNLSNRNKTPRTYIITQSLMKMKIMKKQRMMTRMMKTSTTSLNTKKHALSSHAHSPHPSGKMLPRAMPVLLCLHRAVIDITADDVVIHTAKNIPIYITNFHTWGMMQKYLNVYANHVRWFWMHVI